MSFRYLTRRRPRKPKTPGGIAVARDGYGANWKKQRKKALVRDKYTCQKCGRRAHPGNWWKVVQVHHKRKIRLYYDRRTDSINYKKANRLSNLQTLCTRCHRAADGYGPQRGFTRF